MTESKKGSTPFKARTPARGWQLLLLVPFAVGCMASEVDPGSEGEPSAEDPELGQTEASLSLCGPEIILPGEEGLHSGYVDFTSPSPWLYGFSVKPELRDDQTVLEPAAHGRRGADGIYLLSWGPKKALKIGGGCLATVSADNKTVSCCCTALGAAKGGCRWVTPGTAPEDAWQQDRVLGTPANPVGALIDSSWSTSLPNLNDGTYRCTTTRSDSLGKSFVQDCTRAVSGGYWQTVTIYSNRNNQAAQVRLSTSAIRNATYISTTRCTGEIPNNASRACWGKTYQHSSGTIQTLDRGGLVGVYSQNGAIISIPSSFSPSRPIVR